MNLYKGNLQLISDNYGSRIGFNGDKLLIDNRYLIGLRSLYSISKIKDILDNSFNKFINIYDLLLHLKKKSNIKDILLREYEILIEGVIYGLLYMSSKNTYYFENEQEIFFDLYTNYCKIYNTLNNKFRSAILDFKTPSSSDSESVDELESPIVYSNKEIEILDKMSEKIVNETVNIVVNKAITNAITHVIESKCTDEKVYTTEIDIKENETNKKIVTNPEFSVVYINEEVINDAETTIYNKDQILKNINKPQTSDKTNSSSNRRCCKILKKVSQLFSCIKRVIHNTYKGVVGLFFK